MVLGGKKEDGAEEDDYMSMTISEPQSKETFTQRKLRKQREVWHLSLLSG
jgi:hypothetical protein